jgi:hypothetical protein
VIVDKRQICSFAQYLRASPPEPVQIRRPTHNRDSFEVELRRLINHEDGVWAASRIQRKLPRLRDYLIENDKWTSQGGKLENALADLLRRLIVHMGTDRSPSKGAEAWRQALLIDFAIEQRDLTKVGRQEAAASKLGLERYTYRTDREGRLSPRTAGLIEIIRQIDPFEAEQIEARVAGSRAERAEDKRSLDLVPWTSVLDIQDEYHPASESDLEIPFWWRELADSYLDALTRCAHEAPITIYAGADGPADVGPPLHDDLLSHALAALLPNDDLFEWVGADKADIAERITRAIHDELGGPRWIGSILDELRRNLPRYTSYSDEDSATPIRSLMRDEIRRRRTTSGLMANAIATLVARLTQAGTEAQILSTYYDDDLTKNVAAPVHHIGGQAADAHGPLLLGEGDFLTNDRGRGESFYWPRVGPRGQALARALVESTVVFVGTSLTDPGVVTTLALTKDCRVPRYAVLVLPPLKELTTSTERALAQAVISQRYLHLGVVPIIVDFPQQVPQFLHEWAHRMAPIGRSTPASYRTRAESWFGEFQSIYRIGDEGELPGTQPVHSEATKAFRQVIVAALHDVEVTVLTQLKLLAKHERQRSLDTIYVELWIREPALRTLTRFAVSHSETEPLGPDTQNVLNRDPQSLAPEAFRAGRTVTGIIEEADVARWCVATPIVLEGERWRHLPVGVVTAVANRTDGTLHRASGRITILAQIEAAIEELAKVLSLTPPDADAGAAKASAPQAAEWRSS